MQTEFIRVIAKKRKFRISPLVTSSHIWLPPKVSILAAYRYAIEDTSSELGQLSAFSDHYQSSIFPLDLLFSFKIRPTSNHHRFPFQSDGHRAHCVLISSHLTSTTFDFDRSFHSLHCLFRAWPTRWFIAIITSIWRKSTAEGGINWSSGWERSKPVVFFSVLVWIWFSDHLPGPRWRTKAITCGEGDALAGVVILDEVTFRMAANSWATISV